MSIISVVGSCLGEHPAKALMCPLAVSVSLFCCIEITASAAEVSGQCEAAANGFLQAPSAQSLEELRKIDAESCWRSIGTSNEKLQAMNALLSKGNRSAAWYLASNLRRLDGGNLEDALIALGQFSEIDMTSFLELARDHVLTSHESSDALTMLPLSMSDEPKSQLAAMEKRRAAITRVSEKSLGPYTVAALAEITKFEAEIKRAIDDEGHESQ